MVAGVDGMEVKCPNCDHIFDSASVRGKGAQYTKDWTNIGKPLLNMCAFWISESDIRNHALPKSALLAYFNEQGFRMAALPFSGRISELLGLGLVSIQDGEIKEEWTTSAPSYRLNIHKVSEILNKGGNLQK